jgi:hypothetical protein
MASLSPHGKGVPVAGLAVHPLGSPGASAAAEGWALLDFARGAVLARVAAPFAPGAAPLAFHPDGVLLGAAQRALQRWPRRRMSSAT